MMTKAEAGRQWLGRFIHEHVPRELNQRLESFIREHLPHEPARRRWKLSSRGVLALITLFALCSSASSDSLYAQPLAPQNLRCAGRTLPEPAARWQWEWRWEAPASYVFPGVEGDDGPYAVALDQACNLYVADAQNKQVVKLSQDGSVLARWPTPRSDVAETSSPRGIGVDGQGNVYVSDTPRDRVLKLSPSGQIIATWGTCTPAPENRFCDPTQPGLFIGPEGIAVDGSGSVYVVEVAGNRIQKLTSDGQPLAVWEMRGRAPGELWVLGSPALDMQGNLYVPDEYNNRVLKFSPEGALLAQIGGGPDPSGDPGRFHGPRGVAVDQAGNLYVSDRDNWRVQKLAPDGTPLDQWRSCLDAPDCQFPSAGEEPGQFFYARGLTVDAQGNLYVADTHNKRVQRLMATAVPKPEQSAAP
jgi:DNA-binding beta-propeller fold protein YncE